MLTFQHDALDRPIWHALRSRQSKVSVGGTRARRFASDIAPFAAACDDSAESLIALAALVPAQGPAILLQAGESPAPPGTIVVKTTRGVQMVATKVTTQRSSVSIERLTEADAPAMIALATLTEPGPFRARTHLLGDFFGVKEKGRLVAMAGERMKPEGFTEVSGVCTHPDFRGRGYAAALSRAVATGILDRGETPFLHAYATNTGAIALYESLGFAVRCPVTVAALTRG